MVHTIEPLLQIVTNIPCLEYCYHFLGATEVKNQWKLEPSKPPTIARRSLAKSAFEVRSSTTAAEPAQPGREQHAFQAQQVPGKRLGNFCWLNQPIAISGIWDLDMDFNGPHETKQKRKNWLGLGGTVAVLEPTALHFRTLNSRMKHQLTC